MQKILLSAAFALLACAGSAHAQSSTPSAPGQSPPAAPSPPPVPQYGCDSPESRQFDFWLGDWEFNSQGSKGINRVTKILGGCVVFEQFGDGTPNTLNGQSFSTYDRATKKWKQTWVDNTATYLDFTGGMVDGKIILTREATVAGKKVTQRMVWFNIEKQKFNWNWERSDDMGSTWKTLWAIEYKRAN